MRRLEKSGLLEEYTDTKDKRIKRVRLTPRGTGAFFQAAQKMGAASRIVVGTLNEGQKQELIHLLTLLDSFHSRMYAEHRTESFIEIDALASEQREQDMG
jgi:DNA-binding MarR family transcriptional regulator